MNDFINLFISDELVKKILDLSDKYDNQYFVDQFDINARIKYIKENLV